MFNDFLTTEGERLLAKSIAGTATITFTKMELGDGDRGTSTKAITSLSRPQMTLDIYSVLITGDNNIEITTILESSAISQGFYFREKGIYATDGTTEILFMYGTSGSLAEWLDNLSSAVFTRTIRTIVTLSDSDNVQITIQKGAYASGQDAEDIMEAIQNIKLEGDWATQSQAESILSILDTFVAAYTALRAGKLDNLDALVSSRAPANTALSNAVWTNGRAATLDNLDAKISSRAQASTALSNAVWTDARAVKQDNLDTTVSSRAAAATALSNAMWTNARAGYLDNLPTILSYAYSAMANIGSTADTGGGLNTGNVMAKLNALFSRISSIPTSIIKSINRGKMYIDHDEGSAMATFTTAINPAKAIAIINGGAIYKESANAYSAHSVPIYLNELTATYISIGKLGGDLPTGNDGYVSYQVIEFY